MHSSRAESRGRAGCCAIASAGRAKSNLSILIGRRAYLKRPTGSKPDLTKARNRRQDRADEADAGHKDEKGVDRELVLCDGRCVSAGCGAGFRSAKLPP